MTAPAQAIEAHPAATGRLHALAVRLGCSDGQVYSMAIALTSASVLIVLGGVPLGAPLPTTATGLPVPPAAVAPSPVVVAPPVAVVVPSALPPVGVPQLPVLPLFPTPDGGEEPPLMAGPTAPPPVRAPDGFLDFRVPSPGAPRALTSDATSVYTGTDNSGAAPSQLVVFSRTGDAARQVTVTGQARERSGGLSAAAVSGSQVLATDRSRAALLQIDPRTGAQQVLVVLPDLPPCLVGITGTCQPGGQDLPPTPEGLVVTGTHAYITDAGQGTIWRYTLATKELTAWYASSDFPTSGPSGLGMDTAGRLLFTVAETADVAAPLDGALYRLEVTATGAPGVRTLVATFTRGSAPGPVAVGSADDVYVGLRSAGGVFVISRDGGATVLAGASAAQAPAPGGLSLAAGVLYIADAGRPATSSSGRVLAVPVVDGPVL